MVIKAETLDLVWGASEIAAVIGTSPRRAFDLLEKGRIPGRKVGGRWVADRTELVDFFRPSGASEPSVSQTS